LIPGLDMGVGLVSCLMCTMASRWKDGEPLGVKSYREQTWKRRELVIVTCDPHPLMYTTAAELGCEVNEVPKGPLGHLREESRQLAQGEYLTTWDDDDVSDSDRIRFMVGALSAVPNADAVALLRIYVRDLIRNRLFVSPLHGWEMTMLARREALPEYNRDLQLGEDTDNMGRLSRLLLLDMPNLYTLHAHAGSTASGKWAEGWWKARHTWRGGEP
jgi:hypothetical protein